MSRRSTARCAAAIPARGCSALRAARFREALPPVAIEGEGLLLLPLPEVFSGTETSRASALLAASAPAPRLLLYPDDAERLGLAKPAMRC
ncbi:MAG: hypothetical protein MZV49_02095 [Rhodopseudomonas palustris]|nr:hypothetical protein [Rhodopseudomonas palustris]